MDELTRGLANPPDPRDTGLIPAALLKAYLQGENTALRQLAGYMVEEGISMDRFPSVERRLQVLDGTLAELRNEPGLQDSDTS